ncbi:YihY/virulence factor BrkB family protein [Mucilaginibacter puniceus]
MKWLHRILLNFNFYSKIVKWTKSVVLPGFGTLSIYEVIEALMYEVTEDYLLNKASSLAFNFMLALFPAIIFLFTLIPYIPIDDFRGTLLRLLASILPHNAYMALENTIVDIINNQNGSLLSIGFLSALYFATNGVSTLMKAFNNSSLILEKRTWLKRRMIALTLTVVISISLILAIGIMIAGQDLIKLIQSHLASKSYFWVYVIALTRWIIIIAIFFTTISLLYRYGPSHKLKWNFMSPGSVLATTLAVLTSLGFTYYINNFSSYNKIYGSIGTLIVVMLWLYINSLILLIGFELNASIDLSKRSIKEVKKRYNTFRETKISEM